MELTQELQKKHGPLPAWGWIAIGAAAGFWYIKHRATGTGSAGTGIPTTQYQGSGTTGLGTVAAPVSTTTNPVTNPTPNPPQTGCPNGQITLPDGTCVNQCPQGQIYVIGMGCINPASPPQTSPVTQNPPPPVTNPSQCPPGQVKLPIFGNCVPAMQCPPGQYSCSGGLACCAPSTTTPFTSQNPIPSGCPPGTQQLTLPGGSIGPCVPASGSMIVSPPAGSYGH